MELVIDPGKYVVAVSGGVDSMVLLDLLRQEAGVELIVAHFDHGIRPESFRDRELVERVCRQHRLTFVYAEGRLGANASEETARNARYAFLRKVATEHKAKRIITAHHQDDVIETVLLNILRGTGRKGLASLGSNEEMLRPLLPWPKKELIAYAKVHDLVWHEDETNQDESYLRNYIRLRIMPKLSTAQRRQLLTIVQDVKEKNIEIDQEIANILQKADQDVLEKHRILLAPHDVACEVMAGWLRANGLSDFDRQTIERLVVGVKTRRPGTRLDIFKRHSLLIDKDMLHIT
jgi:tRNA(Ile)-lysidine synthase